MESGSAHTSAHMHVHAVRVTYSEAATRSAPLCFATILQLVPDGTPAGPEAQKRGAGQLSAETHALAVDWGPVSDEQRGERRLDVCVCVGGLKIVLTREPVAFVTHTLLDLLDAIPLVRADLQQTGRVCRRMLTYADVC